MDKDNPFGVSTLTAESEEDWLNKPRAVIIGKDYPLEFHAKEETLLLHEDMLLLNNVHLVLASVPIKVLAIHVTETLQTDKLYFLCKHAKSVRFVLCGHNPGLVKLLSLLKPEKSALLRKAAMMKRNLLEVYDAE